MECVETGDVCGCLELASGKRTPEVYILGVRISILIGSVWWHHIN